MRTVHTWISVISLTYVAILNLRVELIREFVAEGPFLPRLIYYGIFIILLLSASIFILRRKKWSFRFGLIVATIFLIFHILGFQGSGNLLDPEFYLDVISPVPVLMLAVFHTTQGHREVRGDDADLTSMRKWRVMIPTMFVAAFVIGGISYTLITSVTSGASQKIGGDVIIVDGAFHPANLQAYVPSGFTIKVGETVVWYNGDRTGHTVTSTNGVFKSGDMPIGATYSYTFHQPGTYEYVCDYHPFMRGVIVVTASE